MDTIMSLIKGKDEDILSNDKVANEFSQSQQSYVSEIENSVSFSSGKDWFEYFIPETNKSYFDLFSLVHGVSGFISAKAGFSPLESFALAVVWEFTEPILKRALPNYFPDSSEDTLQNQCGDIFSHMVGYYIGSDNDMWF